MSTVQFIQTDDSMYLLVRCAVSRRDGGIKNRGSKKAVGVMDYSGSTLNVELNEARVEIGMKYQKMGG